MKVLIVNGYPPTPQGARNFANFRRCVQAAFAKAEKAEMDEIELVVRVSLRSRCWAH